MALLRRLLVVFAVLASVAGFGSSRALATATPPDCGPPAPDPNLAAQTIRSAHFSVSYTDDPLVLGFITQVQAGTVLAAAERSYASFVAAGFPPPAVAASGKTEFYITDLTQFKLSAVYCYGFAYQNKSSVIGDTMPFNVGADVFSQVGESIGASAPTWLSNGAGAWASWRALNYPAGSITDIGPFDMALDCDSGYDKVNCSANGYENLGGSRWPFYEYLTEKFGPLFIVDIFSATQAAGGDGLAGLQNALLAKGTTLVAEYGAYAAKLLTGGWTATTLSAAIIPVSGAKIQTGISSGTIPTESFGINHLATKFVEIDRGDGAGDHPCYAATLTINVQIPLGVTSQPTFYWSGGGSPPVALAVSAGMATTTVPWDTCAWSTKGYLALPNTSLVDGTSFIVSGTLNVDFSTPATASLPPAPATQFGQAVPASSFWTAPTLSLLGPGLLRLTSTDSQVRLLVQSSGEGSVKAAIGSLSLGTLALRPGGNDLRFTLPAGVLQSLRRALSTGIVLTLTPLAPDGKTTGAAVTRNISVTAVVKKPAKKPANKSAKKPVKKAKH
jgi:hypothetical protein